MFSLRIVDTDHYLADPIPQLDVCHSDFRQAEVRKVPVVRIYGATPQGQKTCMHVHGVFPYMYVPADGAMFSTESHLRQFASSIDKALNVALGNSSSPTRHVYKISLVSGIPFYGYHGNETKFLKVYFVNPLMIKRAGDLLLGGAVMNKVFQPHETHIPYRLQFFIDYNLYGMNMINLAAVKFRQPTNSKDDNANPCSQGSVQSRRSSNCSLPSLGESFLSNSIATHRWELDSIPSDMWLDSDVRRQSTCELEVDVVAADILNRQEVGANVGANPGLVALWEDEQQRRHLKDDTSDLKPQPSQDRGHVQWSDAEAILQERLRRIIEDLAPYIEESDSEDLDEVTPSSSQRDLLSPTPGEMRATPSSVVELHLSQSQQDADSSQDTVVLEEDAECMPPIVDLRSVQRVISHSQSFREQTADSQLQTALSSQDRSLANMLALLADDSPAASQVASQIQSSEEQDSILGISPVDANDNSSVNDEEETAEMSQIVWEDRQGHKSTEGQSSSDDSEEGKDQNSSDEYDLEGMDQSWNSSIWQDVTNQNLPQLDGTSDEKQDLPVNSDKRAFGIHSPESNITTAKSTLTSVNEEKNKSSNGEKINHLGELQILLKKVQRQRVLESSTEAETRKNNNLVLDLRNPSPVQVQYAETSTDSDTDADKSAENKTVQSFVLGSSNGAFACVSVSESSSDNDDSMGASFNASSDLFDNSMSQRAKPQSHMNIFSALSSELSNNSKLLTTNIDVEISKDIQLPFNRDHLCDPKDKQCEKCASPSNLSEPCTESDSDVERLSSGSDLSYPKTGCIVPRRPSSESSSTSADDLRVGPHTLTYDRTAVVRKEQPKFAQVLDRNRPFPEILKELEVSESGDKSNDIERTKAVESNNQSDRTKRDSDLSDYEELLPDQDSTSISENEAGMLDLTGCDDPLDIIEFPQDESTPDNSVSNVEVKVKKRGRPPGRPNKIKKVPNQQDDTKPKKRQPKSPWQMSEDFVQELPPWINSGTDSWSQGESSDTSYVPSAKKEVDKSVKKNRLSLTKKKKKKPFDQVDDDSVVRSPCVDINEHSSLDLIDNDSNKSNKQTVSQNNESRTVIKHKFDRHPKNVDGKEERVWFSSTAHIHYHNGIATRQPGDSDRHVQTVECCVQVPRKEYFRYDFSKICNEKLCLNSIQPSDLSKTYPPVLVTQTEPPIQITECQSNEIKSKKITATKTRISSEMSSDEMKSLPTEGTEISVLKHPALLAVKAPEKGSSRRSSAEGHIAEKGQVCQLDFSFLENLMDTDVEGLHGSNTEDRHQQLHTPPLVIDPDQNANENVKKDVSRLSAPQNESSSTQSFGEHNRSSHFIPVESERDHNDLGDRTVLPSHDSCSFGLALNASNSQSEEDSLSNVMGFGEDGNASSQDTLDKSSRKGASKFNVKRKGKKRPNSLSGYYSDVVSDWEDHNTKKLKMEPNDHYRYRAQRRSADYTEGAFTHIYDIENTTAAVTYKNKKDTDSTKKKGRKREKLIEGVHYIIINKFKGHKSMRVLTPKLKITPCSSVSVKDFSENLTNYCWKKGDNSYFDDDAMSEDSSHESDYSVKRSRVRKQGQAKKVKRKQPRSMYERLSTCFVTKRHKKRKSNGTQSAKFMDTLSLLHNITLAKLTDSPSSSSYNDSTDDHKTPYNDVMFNLALFSPPSSDTGGVSPPQPMSPCEEQESVNLNGTERSLFQPRSGRADGTPSSASGVGAFVTQTSIETLYDTPLSSVEMNKCQSKSPENSSLMGEGLGEIEGGMRTSPNLPEHLHNRRDSNSSGSLYAVKEAVVRLTPPVSTGKIFLSKYTKDILPPDLGPPLCRQVSPRSLHSSSSGSPPSLHSHYERSPRLMDSDGSASGVEGMNDEQMKGPGFMYLYSDADNVVTRMPCKSQKDASTSGSTRLTNVMRQSSDSDTSVDVAAPPNITRSYSSDYSGSLIGSHYSGSDSNSPRNKYQVQCEPISDSSDCEDDSDSNKASSSQHALKQSSSSSLGSTSAPALSPASGFLYESGSSKHHSSMSPSAAKSSPVQESVSTCSNKVLFEESQDLVEQLSQQSGDAFGATQTLSQSASDKQSPIHVDTSATSTSAAVSSATQITKQQQQPPTSPAFLDHYTAHSPAHASMSMQSPNPGNQLSSSPYLGHSTTSPQSPFCSIQSPLQYSQRSVTPSQHQSPERNTVIQQLGQGSGSENQSSHPASQGMASSSNWHNNKHVSPLSVEAASPLQQVHYGKRQQQEQSPMHSGSSSSLIGQSQCQKSPVYGGVMKASPPSGYSMQQTTCVQQSSPGHYGVQQSPIHQSPMHSVQHSPAQASMTQHSPQLQQQSPASSHHSGASLQQQSPLQSVQPSPSHVSPLQQSPLNCATMQMSPSNSSATLQQPSPLQCGSSSVQMSPSSHNGSSLQSPMHSGNVHMPSAQAFVNSPRSPVHNIHPRSSVSHSQVSPGFTSGGSHNNKTGLIQNTASQPSMPQSPAYSDKHRHSNKIKKHNTSPSGYNMNTDILSPSTSNTLNSPHASYSSPLHNQDYNSAKSQLNLDSGLISSDDRSSMLTEIRQFDVSRRSLEEQQLNENRFISSHHMPSVFDLNRHNLASQHSNNNMGMITPSSYANYTHGHSSSSSGGGGFPSMPPMYHNPPPPPIHQSQHNFVTQYPTSGGSQSESAHHSVGHHGHYPPPPSRSCGGYEHGWNTHPGMYPTSAFRHTTCGREEPHGWYPHSGRDPLTVITPMLAPPTKSHLLSGILGYGLSEVQHRDPYCSNHGDLPDRPRVVGGRVLKIDSHMVNDLLEFDASQLQNEGLENWQTILSTNINHQHAGDLDSSFNIVSEIKKNPQFKAIAIGDGKAVITPCKLPPSLKSVKKWLKGKQSDILKEIEEKKNQTVISKSDEKKESSESEKTSQKNDVKGQSEAEIKGSKEQSEMHKESKEQSETHKESKEQSEKENKESKGQSETEYQESELQVADDLVQEDEDQANVCDHAMQTPKSCLKEKKKRKDLLDREDKVGVSFIAMSPDASLHHKPIEFKTPKTSNKQITEVTSDDHIIPVHSTPVQRDQKMDSSPSFTPILKSQQKYSQSDDIITMDVDRDSDLSPALQRKDTEILVTQATPSTSKDIASTSKAVPSTSRGMPSARRSLSGLENPHEKSTLRRALLSSQFKGQLATPQDAKSSRSQIDGPTPNNTYGFRISQQNLQEVKAVHEVQYLTVMSMELHIRTRGDLRPDPEFDPILALFYSIHNDVPSDEGEREVTGVLIVDSDSLNAYQEGSSRSNGQGQNRQTLLEKSGVSSLCVSYFANEEDLLKEFLKLIRRWDPDILVGYEVQMLSWGFLLQRAAQLNMDMCAMLSRIPEDSKENRFNNEKDDYAADHMSDINIVGRVVLNLWRILRHQVTLNLYSFENVAYHVLHKRIPLYSFRALTRWFDHKTHLHRWRTIEHFVLRAKGNLQIMEQIDLIGQTSEFARVFGIEFYHVLSRGSQYRVESMMLRLAKPLNFIPLSPSVQQRAGMKAPECIPLTMEPESCFYSHPVVVLDFQSLYPSIMIAYNYCYSTCLGRVECLKEAQNGAFDFGCSSLSIKPAQLEKLKDKVNICPNGVVFLNRDVRKGVISSMVEEILNTRIMVKQSMKLYKNDKALSRLLHARQLGLKLIANVTFGYTSASYSGRMPCVEIGDSIVRKARETLERAINLVNTTAKWGSKVIYGDTDSMFILMKGRSKEEAFRIGQEIADAVTESNPKPIKLKFEKVYMPCILQTKKRYCGFMYETPDQKDPQFDAKGIETVRRDACPAVAKILERSLKIMFTSRDVSQVKQYFQSQCMKIMEGKVGMQDLIFAKEYRGARGYQPTACVPALEISKRLLASDRRAEPRVGERVPYVIVYGMPGLPLIQLVKRPIELLKDPTLRLNANYYINKQIIPPLDRAFSLMGVDVRNWYNDLPRVIKATPASHFNTDTKKSMISQYFSTVNCPVCDELTNHGICQQCRGDPQLVSVVLGDRIRRWERTYHQLCQLCNSCMGIQDASLPCESLDCPTLFRLSRAKRELSEEGTLRKIQQDMLTF